jgi:hypothetical protein
MTLGILPCTPSLYLPLCTAYIYLHPGQINTTTEFRDSHLSTVAGYLLYIYIYIESRYLTPWVQNSYSAPGSNWAAASGASNRARPRARAKLHAR